ncbi:hypothetical protein ACG7TL_001669 [Trametes sanguinea]
MESEEGMATAQDTIAAVELDTIYASISDWLKNEFVIKWEEREKLKAPGSCAVVRVFIDGRFIHSMVHRPGGRGTVDGLFCSLSARRPFVFSRLATTDDNLVANSDYVNDEIGTITVVVTRVTGFINVDRPQIAIDRNIAEIGPIHEKSKKAAVHVVSFGKEVMIPLATAESPYRVHYGAEKEPYAIFMFHYRPEGKFIWHNPNGSGYSSITDVLRAEGYLPPTSSVRPSRKRRADDYKDDVGVGKPSRRKRLRSDSKIKREDNPVACSPAQPTQGAPGDAKPIQVIKTSDERAVSPIQVPATLIRNVIDLT